MKNFYENILFSIPTLTLEPQSDNSHAIATAHSQEQVSLEDFFSKSVNRIVWQKVHSREFWPTWCENGGNKDYIGNLPLNKETFL